MSLSQLIILPCHKHVFSNMATKRMGSLENLFAKLLVKQEAMEVGIFSKGKSLEKHLVAVEKKCKELNIQDNQKAEFLIRTLDEDIFLEIQSCQDFVEEYEYLLKQLRLMHGEAKSQVSLCTSVLNIKQKSNQKIKDFVSEIRITVMKLFPDEDKLEREKIMLMAFIEGLRNSKHSTILKQISPKTLQEAFEILKNEHAEETDELIMKMDIQIESEIEMMKQKLNAALDRIKDLEYKLERIGKNNAGRNHMAKTTFKGICNYCKKPGHMKRDCRLIKKCRICNLTNHSTENCYHRRDEKNRRLRNVENESVQSVTTSEIEENGLNLVELDHTNEEMNDAYMVTSSTKKTQLHNQRATRYPKEIVNWSNFVEGHGQKPRKLLRKLEPNQKVKKPAVTVISESRHEKAANKPVVSATVEGCIQKNVFLDSGCECNIVDFTFLKQLSTQNCNIKILKTNTGNLSCANGTSMKIIGYTILNIKIGTKSMKMKFAVVESIFPNVLIGIRSMKAGNISIIPAWDCVKIDHQTISFVSKTRIPDLN